jgi:hypothetical protein
LRRFPAEFEDFLSPKGRRLLAGASPLAGALADPRRRFLAVDGLLDPGRVEAGRLLLDRYLLEHLARIDHPLIIMKSCFISVSYQYVQSATPISTHTDLPDGSRS